MCVMSKKSHADKTYVRVTPKAKSALQVLVAQLRAIDPMYKKLSQEDLVGASWLWMGAMSPDVLAKELKPHFRELQAGLAAMGGGDEPAAAADSFDTTTGIKKGGRLKREQTG
jgi:hypothetical protein